MRDMLLQSSGVAAIAAALVHGLIGELKIFPRITIEPARLRTLIRLVWQAGTVAWIGCGVLLIAAPSLELGTRAALDRHHAGMRLRVRGTGQRLGNARPALWLDGDERGRRAGSRRVLACVAPALRRQIGIRRPQPAKGERPCRIASG